jgi:hypothetical protein
MAKDYRAHLRATVAASAAPYGYTLTIWTSGAVTTHERGLPTAWEAVLFLLGAVCGFGLTSVVAYGGAARAFAARSHGAVRLWGAFHLLSVGLAILAAAIIVAVVDSTVAWALVGLVATTVYLLTIAGQFTLADMSAREESGYSRDG